MHPDAAPVAIDGGRVGVLLCHGFTGSPGSLRGLATALAEHDVTVRLPLLPGHGTRWQDMAMTRWPDWYAAIERAYAQLRERCDVVFGVGLSMGAALAVHLAASKPETLAGLVLVNPSLTGDQAVLPAVRVLKRVVPSIPGVSNDIAKPGVDEIAYRKVPLRALDSLRDLWQVAESDLPRLSGPVLVYRSRVDNVVGAKSLELLEAKAGSATIEVRWLDESRHVATVDHDAARIMEGTLDFVRRLSPDGSVR